MLEVMRRGAAIAAALAVAALVRPMPARAADESESRYAVISAFLYNFLMFTEWPADEQLDTGPFRIGVLGANPFDRTVETAISQRNVEGRPIVFEHYEDASSLKPTHILFISAGAEAHLGSAHKALGSRPVLLVGETERFIREGGIIRFFEEASPSGGGKVLRVEINLTAAERAGIRFRSKLMRLARVVQHPLPPGW